MIFQYYFTSYNLSLIIFLTLSIIQRCSTQITDPTNVVVGDEVCFEGYIMDYFCIQRGTLLDNPSANTLQNPELHSVHCLVDVSICTGSNFEILIDPNGDDLLYGRAFQFTNNDKQSLINLARNVGVCSTCNNTGTLQRGFRAEVRGIVIEAGDGMTPPTLQLIAEPVHSNDLSIVCVGAASSTSSVTSTPTSTPTVIPTSMTPPTNSPITTLNPTLNPTTVPTFEPTTSVPTFQPTLGTTSSEPTLDPTPMQTTIAPSLRPTTVEPTSAPSPLPTLDPTNQPTTFEPTSETPTPLPTLDPTNQPTTIEPTSEAPFPSPTAAPTNLPTSTSPTFSPTGTPTTPTGSPTFIPTDTPTTSTASPTLQEEIPDVLLTLDPTTDDVPTSSPSIRPTTMVPSMSTTKTPVWLPTAGPTTVNTTTNEPTTPVPTTPTTSAPVIFIPNNNIVVDAPGPVPLAEGSTFAPTSAVLALDDRITSSSLLLIRQATTNAIILITCTTTTMFYLFFF